MLAHKCDVSAAQVGIKRLSMVHAWWQKRPSLPPVALLVAGVQTVLRTTISWVALDLLRMDATKTCACKCYFMITAA